MWVLIGAVFRADVVLGVVVAVVVVLGVVVVVVVVLGVVVAVVVAVLVVLVGNGKKGFFCPLLSFEALSSTAKALFASLSRPDPEWNILVALFSIAIIFCKAKEVLLLTVDVSFCVVVVGLLVAAGLVGGVSGLEVSVGLVCAGGVGAVVLNDGVGLIWTVMVGGGANNFFF